MQDAERTVRHQPGQHAGPGRAARHAAGRRINRNADRLLLRMAGRGSHWAVLLVVAAVGGAVADTLLPAAAGRTVDVMLRLAATPDAASHASPASPSGHASPASLASHAPASHASTSSLASLASHWLAGCIALIVVIVACTALAQLATGMSAAAATAWLRRTMAGHVLACGLRLPRRFPDGDLASRVIGGAADAGLAPASGVLAIAGVIPPAGSVVALGLIDPWLAAVFAAGMLVLAVALRVFVRDASDTTACYQRAQGAITARLLDALAGARTIAAAGTRAQEAARILVPLADVRRYGRASWRIQARIVAQSSLLVPLLQILVLAVAGVELAARRISPGELLAASQYAVLGAGVGAAIGRLGQLSRARAGARRAVELLAEPPPARGTSPLPAGPGCLQLSAVTVRAGGLILDRVEATIPGGCVVAVAGRSGAGKSLFAALAGRLLDPDEGEVRLDGVPLSSLDRGQLRRAVVYAFDRPALFGRTPREAIMFGITRPAPDRLLSAARDAAALEFLRRLPRGLDTALDEAPMSGGEVQRIGLARAFAHAAEARLLILDDAMSSLDSITEQHVTRALTSRLGGRTCLIIAHRASTAARADLVAWLDGGKLRALRPHHELWRDPRYRAMFSPSATRLAAHG